MPPFARLAGRLRARSVRLLAWAIAFELAGATAILYWWPRGWPLGLILLTLTALRVYSLAERTAGKVAGAAAALFIAVRWLAAAACAASFVVLIVAVLGFVLGSGWV